MQEIERETDKHTDKHADKHTDKHKTYRQTDRQTYTETDRHNNPYLVGGRLSPHETRVVGREAILLILGEVGRCV